MKTSGDSQLETGITLVVGVGEVGKALAEVLERGYRMALLDLEPISIDAPVEVMHLCFPFTSRNQFESAARGYVRRFKPKLTIINSTVLPGTTRRLSAATSARIVYSPVRGKHARMARELLHYSKFVSGLDGRAVQAARNHFKAAGMKTCLIDNPETLELAKLAETSYFGVLIAFAQELNRYAEALGADYDQATTFFEEVDFLPRVKYFPGFIGGHCVIPNINLLQQIAPAPLLAATVKSNEMRAEEMKRPASRDHAMGDD